MLEWWGGLSLASQVFFCFAVPATLVMVIQSLLLLFGIGGLSDGADIDGDGIPDAAESDTSGLSLISVRGIVAFFSIGGWVGVVCDGTGMPVVLSALAAFAAGLAALIGIAFLFKLAFKLQSNGTLDNRNAIGKTATVYIPIPAKHAGTGKVTAVLQERLVELDAVTDEQNTLTTGETVIICAANAQNVTVRVQKTENENNDNTGGTCQ